MDEKKIERVLTGVSKSQRQEARRAVDRARAAENERATKQFVICPAMPVTDQGRRP
jgi:hypothetical protein